MTDRQTGAQFQHLRLTYPDLDFCVDCTLVERDGRWLATASLADQPDQGTGDTAIEALRGALAALGEPVASEMAESAGLETT